MKPYETQPRANIVRECCIVELIKTVTLEGDGTIDDPIREVIRFWDPREGRLLAIADPNVDGRLNAESAKGRYV